MSKFVANKAQKAFGKYEGLVRSRLGKYGANFLFEEMPHLPVQVNRSHRVPERGGSIDPAKYTPVSLTKKEGFTAYKRRRSMLPMGGYSCGVNPNGIETIVVGTPAATQSQRLFIEVIVEPINEAPHDRIRFEINGEYFRGKSPVFDAFLATEGLRKAEELMPHLLPRHAGDKDEIAWLIENPEFDGNPEDSDAEVNIVARPFKHMARYDPEEQTLVLYAIDCWFDETDSRRTKQLFTAILSLMSGQKPPKTKQLMGLLGNLAAFGVLYDCLPLVAQYYPEVVISPNILCSQYFELWANAAVPQPYEVTSFCRMAFAYRVVESLQLATAVMAMDIVCYSNEHSRFESRYNILYDEEHPGSIVISLAREFPTSLLYFYIFCNSANDDSLSAHIIAGRNKLLRRVMVELYALLCAAPQIDEMDLLSLFDHTAETNYSGEPLPPPPPPAPKPWVNPGNILTILKPSNGLPRPPRRPQPIREHDACDILELKLFHAAIERRFYCIDGINLQVDPAKWGHAFRIFCRRANEYQAGGIEYERLLKYFLKEFGYPVSYLLYQIRVICQEVDEGCRAAHERNEWDHAECRERTTGFWSAGLQEIVDNYVEIAGVKVVFEEW